MQSACIIIGEKVRKVEGKERRRRRKYTKIKARNKKRRK